MMSDTTDGSNDIGPDGFHEPMDSQRAPGTPPGLGDHIDGTDFHWRPIAEYTPGALVLARGAGRTVFGYQENGNWFEMLDGEGLPVSDFEPVEWCEAPGGPAVWA